MLDNKFNLGFFPTPIQKLENISENYPAYNIFIKRDDMTGLASGGNKTRKLEYLIKQALDEDCNTVITAGAQQSNHCRQTAAACAKAKLECHLLLGGEEPKVYDGNLLLSSMLGAHIHFTGANRKGEDLLEIKNELKAKNKKCFVIPYGGSVLTGALGFVNAIKELKDQLDAQKLKIDYLFFASSSGGMQAGLTLGLELFHLNCELMPINIDKDETDGSSLEEVVLNLIKEGCELLNIDRKYSLSDIKLNREYDKAGYGNMTENEKNTLLELARKEGILLDPVYTGRAFHAMLDHLKKAKIPYNSNVLFWHSGGFPAIFEYAEKLK